MATIPSLWFDSQDAGKLQPGPSRRLGMDCVAYPILDAKLQVEFVAFMYRDVTQELLTSEKLAVSEGRVDRLMDSDLLGLFIMNLDGQIFDANSAYLKIIGCSKADVTAGNVKWTTATPLEFWDAGRKGMEILRSTGNCPAFEKEYLRRDGSRIPVMIGGTMLSNDQDILCFALDLTNVKRLEQQLRQAQKMEAIGQLAGGIAHDFNNILSLILLNVEFLLEDLKDQSMFEGIVGIRNAAEKATRLTKQLLAFSRNQVMNNQVLDTKLLFNDMKQLFARLLSENIRLNMDLSEDVPNVRADLSQMEQILMNLAVNARDAMPLGGTLSVSAKASTSVPGRGGKFLHLTVADTGCGMDEKTKTQIFEPFFTTKEIGKGTGLGLSTVFGIVKQAGGEIEVESSPGRGAKFHIYIPACDDPVHTSSTSSPIDIKPSAQTVLLVEDENELRAITASFLRRKGYEVLDACNGEEAHQIMHEHRDRITMIVTDVIMPEKTGPALIEELRQEGIVPKVLFLSGYSSDELVRHGITLESTMFLSKPYSTRDLLSKIQEMMGRN